MTDWLEPNVIRAALVPLYNSFEDVFRFVEALEEIVSPIVAGIVSITDEAVKPLIVVGPPAAVPELGQFQPLSFRLRASGREQLT